MGGTSIWMSDTSNANMTAGLTIQQGAGVDNEVLAFKSSGDVVQAVTDLAEADTFGTVSKAYGDQGGLNIRGFVDSGAQAALFLEGITSHSSPQSGKATDAKGVVNIQAYQESSNAIAELGADDNILAIYGGGATRFIFDADGDSHQDVGTAWTNYDGQDDVQLTRSLGIALDPASIIQTKWDDWGKDHFKEMEDFGLIGKVSDEDKAKGERGLVNMTLLAKLHNGAIGQLGAALNDMKEVYQERIAALESRLMRLEN